MATVTFTTTAADDARIAPAFGALLGLSGNANAAQVKQAVTAWIAQVVKDYETNQAAQSAIQTARAAAPVAPQ